MTEPTDNDLDVLLAEHWPAFATSGARPLQGMRAAMRDAIAKWGTPAPVGVEPVAWIEHSGGGIAYAPYKAAAMCLPEGVKFDLYTAPQPVEREPLTHDQALDAFCRTTGVHQFVQAFMAGVRFAEQHHGTKGKEAGNADR